MLFPETTTVMRQLVMDSPGYDSVEALMKEAVAKKLIQPGPPVA